MKTKYIIPAIYSTNIAMYHGIVESLGAIYHEAATVEKIGTEDISILIPSFQKRNTVILSVLSAVSQTGKPNVVWVHLMDDDADLEHEIRSIDSQLIKVTIGERMSPVSVRNWMVSQCTTPYFIFLDADDVLTEHAALALSQNATDVTCGVPYAWDYDIGDEKINRARVWMTQNLTCLIKKEYWEKLGGLRELATLDPEYPHLHLMEDLDFFNRMIHDTDARYTVIPENILWRSSSTVNHQHTSLASELLLHIPLASTMMFNELKKAGQLHLSQDVKLRLPKEMLKCDDAFRYVFTKQYPAYVGSEVAWQHYGRESTERTFTRVQIRLRSGCSMKCPYCCADSPELANIEWTKEAADKYWRRFEKAWTYTIGSAAAPANNSIYFSGGEPGEWSDEFLENMFDFLSEKVTQCINYNVPTPLYMWATNGALIKKMLQHVDKLNTLRMANIILWHIIDWRTCVLPKPKLLIAHKWRYQIIVEPTDDIQVVKDFIERNYEVLSQPSAELQITPAFSATHYKGFNAPENKDKMNEFISFFHGYLPYTAQMWLNCYLSWHLGEEALLEWNKACMSNINFIQVELADEGWENGEPYFDSCYTTEFHRKKWDEAIWHSYEDYEDSQKCIDCQCYSPAWSLPMAIWEYPAYDVIPKKTYPQYQVNKQEWIKTLWCLRYSLGVNKENDGEWYKRWPQNYQSQEIEATKLNWKTFTLTRAATEDPYRGRDLISGRIQYKEGEMLRTMRECLLELTEESSSEMSERLRLMQARLKALYQ